MEQKEAKQDIAKVSWEDWANGWGPSLLWVLLTQMWLFAWPCDCERWCIIVDSHALDKAMSCSGMVCVEVWYYNQGFQML